MRGMREKENRDNKIKERREGGEKYEGGRKLRKNTGKGGEGKRGEGKGGKRPICDPSRSLRTFPSLTYDSRGESEGRRRGERGSSGGGMRGRLKGKGE